jgi:hypothetical protein
MTRMNADPKEGKKIWGKKMKVLGINAPGNRSIFLAPIFLPSDFFTFVFYPRVSASSAAPPVLFVENLWGITPSGADGRLGRLSYGL